MSKFVCQVEVKIYCFVPLNSYAACKYYTVTKGFFGMRTPHCLLHFEILASAAYPYIGVILPCKQCEEARQEITEAILQVHNKAETV